jgi:hypothetical protein
MSDEPWVTPEQAAEEIMDALGRKQFQVSANRVRLWLRMGRLIGKQVDGRWRIYPRDLQDYIKLARNERSWRRNVYRGGRFSGR